MGAGLLPGPSVPLQWPAFRPRSSWRSVLPWWWPCQRAPGHTAALAGQAGQWGQKETRGRELLVLLTFAGVVMDYLCLSDLSFPLRGPCSSPQRVCLPAPCCQLRGVRRALRLRQRQRGAPSCRGRVGALTATQARCAPSLDNVFSRAALFTGEDAGRGKMSVSGGLGPVAGC